MATYLLGYHAPEGRDATNVLRGLIMSRWLESVRDLILADEDVAGHA
jgi:hypothetical protein